MAALFHSPIIFLSLITVKFITPSNVDKTEWERLNNNLKLRLAPLHLQIGSCNDPVQIQVLGDQVSLEIARFCSEHSELFLQEEQNSPREKFITHSNKTVAQLEALKKSLRKEALKTAVTLKNKRLSMNVSKL